jgi:hypothetical protein
LPTASYLTYGDKREERMKRKNLRECGVTARCIVRDNARRAIANAADGRTLFTEGQVFYAAGTNGRNTHTRQAVAELLRELEQSGSIRPAGAWTWAVVSYADLCDTLYGRAA